MFKPHSTFHVLYTSDLEKTYSFYKAIQAVIMERDEAKLVVKVGDYDLHFCLDSKEEIEPYLYIAKANNRGNGIVFYIEVEDLDKAYEVIKNSEGKLVSKIWENWWDARELLIEDPNGYKFALYQMK